MPPLRIAVVGAGWAGIGAARTLHDAGVAVEVFEKSDRIGGHSRTEVMDGVVYEPNGAHIFHTSNERVARFAQRFGLVRPYEHRVVSEVFFDESDESGCLLSWPPQLDELATLPMWTQVSRELDDRPDRPTGADLETYVTSMMGPTLYDLFVRGYTIKQWGRDPSEISSSFAPKRIEFRSDGNRRLFRDRWEFFGPNGANDAMSAALDGIEVHHHIEVSATGLDDLVGAFDRVVITAALDRFLGRPGELEWRGVEMVSCLESVESEDATRTPSYVVNRPSLRVPYTRTIETKHATGQRVAATVVSEEHPGSDASHYPVPTVDGRQEAKNEKLRFEIESRAPIPVQFCGRLANYTYINQDEAIMQGMVVADQILSET